MDYEFMQTALTESAVPASYLKKQDDFVCFLVRGYFMEPCKSLENEQRLERGGGQAELAYCEHPFSHGVDRMVGRICNETLLIDQKHVQSKSPFVLIEKPYVVPAIIGVLLQRIFYEELGIFVSCETFEKWATRALGFSIRLSRVWLDAEHRVENALATGGAHRLINTRSACETGVHAIRQQGSDSGALFFLWCGVYQLCRSKLKAFLLPVDAPSEEFALAIKEAIATRRRLEVYLSSEVMKSEDSPPFLYSVAEPEICSCFVYNAFYNKYNIIFAEFSRSRESKKMTAECMMTMFQGCLNAFTLNRYTASNLPEAFATLDALQAFADNKAAPAPQALNSANSSSFTTSPRGPQVLSCDHVSSDVRCFATSRGTAMQFAQTRHCVFSEIDTRDLDFETIFPFHILQIDTTPVKAVEEDAPNARRRDAEAQGSGGLAAGWQTMNLSDENVDVAQYILSAEEQVAKKEVFSKMHAFKRGRSSV